MKDHDTKGQHAVKRVLDVGQCQPDHWAIRHLLEGELGVEVVQSHSIDDAIDLVSAGSVDLVLVNRKLDADYSNGLELVRRLKASPTLNATPIMLVSNYPEAQAAAIADGALPGFGKAELHAAETKSRLQNALGL